MPKDIFSVVKNFFALYFFIWVVTALVALGLFVGLIWVAVHFISKFW